MNLFRAATLSLALLLAGCSPTWTDALKTAGDVSHAVACAVCREPLPPAPVVAPNAPPTVESTLALLAWALEVQRRMAEIQRAGAEELAKHATPDAAPVVP